MKPRPHSGSPIPPSPQRLAPTSDEHQEALRAAAAAREQQRQTRDTLRRAIMIGGFALIAIFVGLELLKPASKPATRVMVEASQGKQPAAKAEPSNNLATSFDVKPTTPTPDIQTPPPPTPDVTPVPEVAQQAEEPNKLTEAELLAKEPVMILAGTESLRDAAIARDKALLARAIDGKAWNAYCALLARSIDNALTKIRQGQGVNRFDTVWSEPALYQALLRWRTITGFTESAITRHVTDAYTGEFITWMLHHNEAMEEFLLTLSPKDDGGSVLKFLMEARSVNEEDFKTYFSLAVACAVVFDNPVKIPNPIGNKEYAAETTVDPLQRYRWFVDNDRKGKLAAPVHRSSARDLIWVVCAPVTTSELEWSLHKMNLHRKNWGNAYGMVKYLMKRAVEGLNPYDEYSFAEILKKGGICGDQSYFCVNTARAQGIPAMTIGGETDLGGHAWAGLKTDDDEWNTTIGRIGGVSKGQTGNPQTGESITEQEIQSWNDRHHRSKVTTLAVWRHFWLADCAASAQNDDVHTAAVHLANQIGPSFNETWKFLHDLLEKQTQLVGNPAAPNNLDEWKTFARDMRHEFKDNPRMATLAAETEQEYIFPYGPEGDARRSLMRERRRIERDAGEQKDLIADSLKREADLLVQRGGPNTKREISQLYDRALRDYGGSITGFKMMAENYFGYMKDDKELARKAARDIELAFKRVVETGTTEWFRANTESTIYKMICDYYRTAGDNERADLLEKRYQILLRRAKRNAI